MKNPFPNAFNALAAAGLAVGLAAAPAPAKADAIDVMLSKGPGEFVCNSARTLCTENLRTGASDFTLNSAPSHSARGRVAVLVHGGDKNFLKATFAAAQNFAERGIETRYVLLPDNNADPSDAMVSIYSNGLPAVEIGFWNPLDKEDFTEIAQTTLQELGRAYDVMREEQQRQISHLDTGAEPGAALQ